MKKDKITFEEHQRITADDCDLLAEMIKEVAAAVRKGNLTEFEKFFIEGGTEEGDAKLFELRDRILLRFVVRQERL